MSAMSTAIGTILLQKIKVICCLRVFLKMRYLRRMKKNQPFDFILSIAEGE